jgi:hypothetical protein
VAVIPPRTVDCFGGSFGAVANRGTVVQAGLYSSPVAGEVEA